MSVGFSFSYFSSCYFCLLVFMALFHSCSANKNVDDVLCMDIERQALLRFKHGLIDEAGRLASWVDEDKDCCRWVGIVCENITGHVQQIHLRGSVFNIHDDYIHVYEEDSKNRLRGNISRSLLYLKQLKHLDLSCNNFEGVQIPIFMGSLGTLRYLNLSHSNFGGLVPPQLGNLSELHVLCLGGFYNDSIELSSMNMQWLSNLRMLHHLHLSYVDLNKVVDWLQVINTLPSLVELRLSDCKLSYIQPHVTSLNITSLSLLDLSLNDFSYTFVPRWIFTITSLVSLDLSYCYFQGPTPSMSDGFRNLTSLKLLHVSGNYFMNSSLVLKGLSSLSKNLISLDISECGVSSSVLGSLHNLTSLLHLDLSQNQLIKTISKSLCNFCNLIDINLGRNNFGNISLTYLLKSFFECKQPSLESLTLSYLKLSSHLPDELVQLVYLKHLELRYNKIAGKIPDSIERLSSLEVLNLDSNLISGPFPDSVGQLSSLEVLILDSNQISGPIPYSIGRLSSLKVLRLASNSISGPIPNSIGQLSSLVDLDLSHNQLNGSLPDNLGQLSKLKRLDLSSNFLTGVVTEAHFDKLAKLKELIGNNNSVILRPRLAHWIPPFQLQYLYVNSWDLGPQFPLWLQSQRDLIGLGLSKTNISSTVPEWFWRSFPNLLYLYMSQNRIQGRLLSIHAPLIVLDLSSNNFSGKLPKLSYSPFIGLLDLSNNSFTGSLSHLLCSYDRRWTQGLNLANNHLSGVIPECWMNWSYLSFLNLENNNLSGRIPKTFGSLSQMTSMNMRNNKLSGMLPASLKNLTNLEILQLDKNKLLGSIPAWLGRELSSLKLLKLRSNNFVGNIPHELCYLDVIQILDLANNNLSGNIPRCFNNFSILSGKKNISSSQFETIFDFGDPITDSASLLIKGREDIYNTILGLVTVLDLSNNSFYGQIPYELMALHALRSLNLSRNWLTGNIPKKIGDMKSLESFDASLNQLSGELPLSLSSLSSLNSFNVSYNNLVGRIPLSTQLQSLDESSFLGNKLCGDPLTKHCAVKVGVQKKKEGDGSHDGAEWGLIISIMLGFVAGFWVVVAPLIVNRTWRTAYFRFLNDIRYVLYGVVHRC